MGQGTLVGLISGGRRVLRSRRAGCAGRNARAIARECEGVYGLSRAAVEFWDIHEMADAEHSAVGDSIVVRHATDAATQARVRDALQHSLDA
jgi:pyrroloquinoline quinone (PQQ) biosynthesis protein C